VRRLKLTLANLCPYLTPLTHYCIKTQVTDGWCKPTLCLVMRAHLVGIDTLTLSEMELKVTV
jgi:hypothetical protein